MDARTDFDPDVDVALDLDEPERPARTARVPNAVWINRPATFERGEARPALPIIVAALVATVALVGAVLMHEDTDVSPVPPARAGATGELAGNGPTGYFPDLFPRGMGEIEPQPPSF